SIGGAAGGLLAAVIAPLIFPGYWEFQLSIWMCAFLLFLVLQRDSQSWIHGRSPTLGIALFAGAMLMPELLYAAVGKPGVTPSYYLSATIATLLIGVVAFRNSKSRATSRPGLPLQV